MAVSSGASSLVFFYLRCVPPHFKGPLPCPRCRCFSSRVHPPPPPVAPRSYVASLYVRPCARCVFRRRRDEGLRLFFSSSCGVFFLFFSRFLFLSLFLLFFFANRSVPRRGGVVSCGCCRTCEASNQFITSFSRLSRACVFARGVLYLSLIHI